MSNSESVNGKAVSILSTRYLTKDLPGIKGAIKIHPQDFLVEEIPLYAPSGDGEHTFFGIRKMGLSTFRVVQMIARALGVPPNRISYAGLKDAQAVTSQTFSVHGISPDVVMAVELPNVQVLWANRHRRKLKIGHLLGNRFTIRIREVDEAALEPCQQIIDVLARRGVPNYFGPQRFGLRGDSALLGQAVMRKNVHGFFTRFLGRPQSGEHSAVSEARSCFDDGRWQAALDLMPQNMADERRALQILARTDGDHDRAYASVPNRLKTFFVSAYQSHLFNLVLDARLETLDVVHVGDVAMKHPGHSLFRVDDEEVEQARVVSFEISPTGPIFGYKMMEASGRQGELESSVLESEALSLEDFRVGGGVQAKGTRRSLRFQVQEPSLQYDDGIVLSFQLPRGCYATTVLSEIMKVSLDQSGLENVMELTEL